MLGKLRHAKANRAATIGRVSAGKIVTLLAIVAKLLGPVVATGVLHCFPIDECSFNRQKISRRAVVRVLLDSGASPCESAAACRSTGILSENLRQRVRELTIKCRNAGAATHDLPPDLNTSALPSPVREPSRSRRALVCVKVAKSHLTASASVQMS
jgi:hypothetical protein